MNKLNGTPKTEAIEKAVIIIPMAVPRRSALMASPTMASTNEPRTPPKAPVRVLAKSKE